tara:strand:- start:19 stop:555 length:537 start_codon:yes stop_codon:yes gene_type:complete
MYIYIIILFIIVLFLNIISSSKVKIKAECLLKNPYTPLPDLIHNIIPKIPTKIPDYFLFICIFITIFNYKTLLNIKKNLLCISLCFIVRSFSVFFTIMPTCMEKPKKISNIYDKIFLSTHDLMFSGHSLFFIGIGNMLNSYLIKYLGALLLIISRQHYTIDVFVSGLVYFFVYTNIKN